MNQYQHPGDAFIDRYGPLQQTDDVGRYVAFLLREAGVSGEPPIDFNRIYQHFGMPVPLRVPLVDQQGILLDSNTGLILIKEDDPIVRQRFTEGHELMELLFEAQERLEPNEVKPEFQGERKEQLCDRGAAELLMPEWSFVPKVNQMGMTLRTGRTLAELYQTSLLATLIRMVQHGTDAYALVMWQPVLRASESNRVRSPRIPTRSQLRVWWRTWTQDWQHGFIPKNKSISPTSLIRQAYTTAEFHEGMEWLDFGQGAIHCYVEALPLKMGGKRCVLSLLHAIEPVT